MIGRKLQSPDVKNAGSTPNEICAAQAISSSPSSRSSFPPSQASTLPPPLSIPPTQRLKLTHHLLTVWIKSGLCTVDSLINILLCMLGYIPGLLHAWYIIAKYPEDSYGAYEPFSDIENQHVTYYYVNDSRNNSHAGLVPQQQQYPSQNRGYGTVQGMRSPEVQPQPQSQPKPQPQPQQQQQQRQGQQGAGEGSSQGQGVPPSYEQAVAGDNKVQT
ncbi:MAG: hypothetical protein Q9166_003891 [cf. Caloplaca sp. 2 TL-2023]